MAVIDTEMEKRYSKLKARAIQYLALELIQMTRIHKFFNMVKNKIN